MATHKLTRKDLKKDSFAYWMGRSVEFLQENYLRLGGVLLAVVVVVFGGLFYVHGKSRAREQASYLLYQGESLLSQGAFGAARASFQECVDKYGGTWFGRMAQVDLAHALIDLGENDAALDALERAKGSIDGTEPMASSMLHMKATALANLKRYSEAADVYRRLLQTAASDNERYELSFLLADCLKDAGQVKEGYDVLTQLQQAYLKGDLSQANRELDARLQLFKSLSGQ